MHGTTAMIVVYELPALFLFGVACTTIYVRSKKAYECIVYGWVGVWLDWGWLWVVLCGVDEIKQLLS